MAQAAWFDHVVVNDGVERAAQEVAAIIERPTAAGLARRALQPNREPAPPIAERNPHP